MTPEERQATALEKIAEQLEKTNELLTQIVNKSPWDDPKTQAILGTAIEGTGMYEELKSRGFDVNGT